MHMKWLWIFIVILAASACRQAPPVEGVEYIDTAKAKEVLSEYPDIVLLDVRRPDEFEEGHIEGAANINVLEKDFEEKVSQLDKKKTYLVYCRSGKRSTIAVQKMADLGFNHIYMLEGGYLDWQDQSN